MSTASQGRAREHKVRDHLIANGWHMIMRAAGSKGPADLILAHETRGQILVQVGTASKTLGPADRARICTAARLCNAWPILATVHKGRITYHHITLLTPRTWAEWLPGDIT